MQWRGSGEEVSNPRPVHLKGFVDLYVASAYSADAEGSNSSTLTAITPTQAAAAYAHAAANNANTAKASNAANAANAANTAAPATLTVPPLASDRAPTRTAVGAAPAGTDVTSAYLPQFDSAYSPQFTSAYSPQLTSAYSPQFTSLLQLASTYLPQHDSPPQLAISPRTGKMLAWCGITRRSATGVRRLTLSSLALGITQAG